MNTPERLAVLRRRIAVVVVVDALCLMVSAACIYGYLSRHVAWMGAGFAAAMIAGFAAQIWLVVSFARDRSPRG